MNICLTSIAAALPIIFWWRFRNVPLDRDYCPYGYPGVFKTGFLTDGHVDIKGPLIHWSYKAWMNIASLLPIKPEQKMKLLPSIGIFLAIFIIGLHQQPGVTFALAILLCSPTLWVHMANTEWLTISVISLALTLPNPYAWLLLGLLPWVNQKNLLLIAPVAWALGLSLTPIIPHAGLMLAPSLFIMGYLAFTRRLNLARFWLIKVPAKMGQARTFKRNTISALKILTPCLALFAPILATLNGNSPWAWVAGVVIVSMILSKQIVPHHFILLTLPICLASQPQPFTFAAIALIWCFRDGICWLKPELTYPMTFPNYGGLLEDAATIEKWIKDNTKPDEVIWVNGAENQIYLNTMRKAWRIEIPELEGVPDGESPRVVVHSAQTAKKFDYEGLGYETELISNMGHYTLVVKK